MSSEEFDKNLPGSSEDPEERFGEELGKSAVVGISDDDKLMAALAWLATAILSLPIAPIIMLLADSTKERSFQRHHAITALLFYAAAIVYEVLAGVVFGILTAVPLLGVAACLCLWVIFFVPHVLALYYAVQAYGGKRIELPYLSNFARQQGWL